METGSSPSLRKGQAQQPDGDPDRRAHAGSPARLARSVRGASPFRVEQEGFRARTEQPSLGAVQPQQGVTLMLYWAAVFFVIAIIAAVFGFGGIAAGAAGVAKVLFFLFLILAVLSLIFGRGRTV